MAAASLLAVVALVGCGDDSSGPVARSNSSGARATGTVETSTGLYRVDLSVGPAAGALGAPCAPAPSPGRTVRPVLVTVVNTSPDQPAPFPPLRVELVSGGSPAEVLVQDPAGACTFTPRGPALEPGATVSFSGTTPLFVGDGKPGSAGAVQVAVSESDFAVSVPVP